MFQQKILRHKNIANSFKFQNDDAKKNNKNLLCVNTNGAAIFLKLQLHCETLT